MANALTAIRAEAKRIRKAHPNVKWQTAIKQASAKYNAGKVGKTRKKVSGVKKVKVSGVKKSVGKAKVSGVMAGTASSHIRAVRDDLELKLGKEVARQVLAKKVSERRQSAKKVNEIKSKLRKLSGF